MRRSGARFGVLVVLASMLSVGSHVPAFAGPVPANADWSEAYFPSADGTLLHADVFRPKGMPLSQKTPVLITIHPYFMVSLDEGPLPPHLDVIAADVWARGYTYVQVAVRGSGASAGCYDMAGPGEQQDVKAAVEWAADQPWSTGKVGIFGGFSYPGGTAVMALAERPRGLAAAVIQAGFISAYRAGYMNRNRYVPFGYLIPPVYGGISAYQTDSLRGHPERAVNAVQRALDPRCVEPALGSLDPDPEATFWRERDLIARASGSNVPVLWTHGFVDDTTHPDNFLDVFRTLTGPHHAWFGQWGHWPADPTPWNEEWGLPPNIIGRLGFLDEAMRWLDRYVKGESPDAAPVDDDPIITVEDGTGAWRAESAWPPTDARAVELAVLPGSYRDVPGNYAEDAGIYCDACGGIAVPAHTWHGVGSWTLTQPFPYDARIAGVATLSVDLRVLTSGVNLIALLYDVADDGTARIMSRAGAVVESSGVTTIDLYPQDWHVVAGHRLGLLLTGSDDDWFTPGKTGTDVTTMGGTLKVPFLACARSESLEGNPSEGVWSRSPFTLAADTITSRTSNRPLPPPMTECPE